MSLATIEQHHFRRVCSKYATGITIVTVLDSRGAPHGLTVNSFTSVSLSPPLVLFCIDRQTPSRNYFHPHTRFAVNVLHEEQKQPAVAIGELALPDLFDAILSGAHHEQEGAGNEQAEHEAGELVDER